MTNVKNFIKHVTQELSHNVSIFILLEGPKFSQLILVNEY